MIFTIHDVVGRFSDEARDEAERMIADAERFGILADDPWSSSSLSSIGEKFLASSRQEFSKDSLAMFLGEGLVRNYGGQWSAHVGKHVGELKLLVQVFVEFEPGRRPRGEIGAFPYQYARMLEECGDPNIVNFFYRGE